MTKEQWEFVTPYFSPKENWGEPDKMDFRLIWLLYQLRCQIGLKFFIHRGYDSNGSEAHKSGMAVDFRIENIKQINISTFGVNTEGLLLYDNHEAVKKIHSMWWFGRVGFYPYWKYYDKQWAGFHLDVRGKQGTRWYRDRNGKYYYCT